MFTGRMNVLERTELTSLEVDVRSEYCHLVQLSWKVI